MSMGFVTVDASFNYFMADTGGNCSVLEYVTPIKGHPGNSYILPGCAVLRLNADPKW